MRFEEDQLEIFKGVIDKMCPAHNSDVIPYNNCEKVFSSIAVRGKYSPDFSGMRLREHIPIFVYESGLRNGGEFHKLLIHPKTRYLGDAYTATDNYILKSTFGDTYTVAFKDETKAPVYKRAHIRGQVFVVPPKVLLDIDYIHRNGKMYQRELRNFFMRDQGIPMKSKSVTPSLRCWMYLGILDHWENVPMHKKSMSQDYRTQKWMYYP